MILGSKVEGLTYPKCMYYSTSPCGFFHIQHARAMPQRLWMEEDDKRLASLYGLTFEKKLALRVWMRTLHGRIESVVETNARRPGIGRCPTTCKIS